MSRICRFTQQKLWAHCREALLSVKNNVCERKRWMLTAGAQSRGWGWGWRANGLTHVQTRLRAREQSQDSLNPGPDAAVWSDKSTKKGSSLILQETSQREFEKQLETSAWRDSWLMRNGNCWSSDSLTLEFKLIKNLNFKTDNSSKVFFLIWFTFR